MEKPLNSPAPFRPISLTSYVSKIFEHIIPSRLLFFLESNSILSPRQAAFRRGRSTLDQFFYLSQFISDGFNKLRRGSWTIPPLMFFRKRLTVSGTRSFPQTHFGGPLSLFCSLNSILPLIDALAWFNRITIVVPLESVEVFRKDPFLALYFSLSSSMIFRHLCLLLSVTLFMLTIWTFGPLPPRSLLWWGPYKEL